MLTYFNIFMTWLSLGLLVCALLCKVSKTCDYFVKLFLLYVSYFLTGTLLIPHGLLHYGRPWKTSRFSADLLEPLNQLLGIKYNVKGAENIDKKKAYVVVCNHQSSLDVLAVLQVWKLFDRAAMVAKRELQYTGTFGLGLKFCGTVFVDRASSEAGRAAINAAGKRARENGTTLWIFPEGTRNHSGQMMPFKKGAFHVAVDSGLPILPVVMSEYDFLDHKKKRFGKGVINIQILDPIPTDSFINTKENLNSLIETTRTKMMEAQRLNQEGNNNKKSQ